MEALDVPQVFVAHVKVGYEDRRRSIEEQLARLGIPFEFMLERDIPDLTAEDLARFEGWMLEEPMRCQISCSLKHLLIYEALALRGLPAALVLEDDILLAPNFVRVANQAIREARTHTELDPRLVISFENSMLRFVPRMQRQQGRLLYQADCARCTGAYYLTQAAAISCLEAAKREKISRPIDHHHTYLCRSGQFPIFWCHPPIAEQGSMNGRFASAIGARRSASPMRRIGWELDKRWKQLLSHLR